MRRRLEYVLPVVFVAVVGHLLVLRTWWFHDDWVFLADAAGIAPRGDALVRVASYQWYWSLLQPLFGLHAWAWGLTRLALHAGSALFVAGIAARTGLDRHTQIFAALVFAALPPALESLYWGTGAVELLGVFFALAAVERWLAGSPRARWAALALAGLAVLSKESGLLLVLFFAAGLTAERRMRSGPAVGVVALAILACWAAWQVGRDFDTTADYAVDFVHAPRDFLVYGMWLVTPAVLLRDAAVQADGSLLAGAAFWALWGVVAHRAWQRGRRLPAQCLAMGLLAVAPATVLGDHAVPRYLYGPGAALALTVAGVAYPAAGPRRATLVLFTALLLVVAWSGTAYLRDAQYPGGRPIHRLAFKEYVSRFSRQQLAAAGITNGDTVVVVRGEETDDAQWALLRAVLMDDLAIRLMHGPDVKVTWTTDRTAGEAGAVVLTTRGVNLLPVTPARPRR